MTRMQIRRELLGQHTDLRHGIFEARALVQRWRAGDAARDAVRAALLRLGDVLEAHNEREEELLSEIIATVDRLGPERATIMNERHVEEHHELHGALIVASESASAVTGGPVLEFLFERLLEHMAREEDAFLGVDVLGDDERDERALA